MKSHLIIQGPFFNDSRVNTEKTIIMAIESRIFSKITLSTYRHPQIEDLIKSFDIEVIVNDDPESQGYSSEYRNGITKKKYQNINRQIKTFVSAVQVDQYDFIFKMRSDCYIHDHLKLQKVIKNFMSSDCLYMFSDTTSVRFDTEQPRNLFHLSDWFIGFKNEQSKIVKNIPYIDERENQNWLDKQNDDIKKKYQKKRISTRYGGEVWITLNLLSRDSFPIKHNLDYSLRAEELYKNYLKKIMCVPMYTMGMRSMKMRTVHIPHYDRYENYLGAKQKIIYIIIGYFYKLYVTIREYI